MTGIFGQLKWESLKKIQTNTKWEYDYRKVPIFLDAKKHCCNRPKIPTKRPNLWDFHQKDANGKANSEDPDQNAPLLAV